jgi:nucleoside transporter
MILSVRSRLCIMMFLEFFIWGAWLPLIFGYIDKDSLNFTTLQQTLIINAFAVSSLVAIFFSNQFADRMFAAEKFVAFSHFVGGLAMVALTWVTGFELFLGLMLLHCLFYVPTISITNSIAFSHMKSARDFGFVRLWGTIGWIAASWPFVFILVNWSGLPAFGSIGIVQWLGEVLDPVHALKGESLKEATRYIFLVAGIGSLVLAAFSLILPHTPPTPTRDEGKSLAWLEAMRLLAKPFLLILFLVTFIDAAVHQCYFVLTAKFLSTRVGIPANWVMPVMSIGQIAEIGTMAILALVLKRLGWRLTMVLGVLGHFVRFATFALFPEPAAAIAVNVLHGICYAFFFATVYIFVDENFPKDARASAQGLFNVLILGVGPFVGTYLATSLRDNVFMVEGVTEYKPLFLTLAGIAAIGAGILFLFFHPPRTADETTAALAGGTQGNPA